jgi:hypothetical protein
MVLHGEARCTRARWLWLPFPAQASCSVVPLLLGFAFLFLFSVPAARARQISEASAWIQQPPDQEDHAERSNHQSTPFAIASRPLFTAFVNSS